MSEVLFASFAASWFITRLGIYPTWIIYSATVEAPQLIQYFPGYFVFNALLSALLLLNIVWAYLICKVVYNSLMANETIANDIRSDTSEDGKDATTGMISEIMSCEELAIFSQILHLSPILEKITQYFHHCKIIH